MNEEVILFQGDSITDCERFRQKQTHAGTGYPLLVSSHLGCNEPGRYTCLNRGISGDRVVDLYARIKRDMINLNPNYMSILIGINDVSHEYVWQNGVDADKFEMVYGLMIEELLQALPNLKIMILEPFLLPGTVTVATEENPDRWEFFSTECALRREATKRIAEKYDLAFVPLQDLLNQVNENMPMGYWLYDGVHPTPAGHELIKGQWLKAFEALKG